MFDSIEDTHHCYNQNMKHIITHMTTHDQFFLATHNVDTVNAAKQLIVEQGFKESASVCFGQLRGFSDQVTNSLALDGFRVFKYLPFGPTEQVMPYLVRRGQESRQVLREQKFQNEFLKAEIFSRMKPF